MWGGAAGLFTVSNSAFRVSNLVSMSLNLVPRPSTKSLSSKKSELLDFFWDEPVSLFLGSGFFFFLSFFLVLESVGWKDLQAELLQEHIVGWKNSQLSPKEQPFVPLRLNLKHTRGWLNEQRLPPISLFPLIPWEHFH